MAVATTIALINTFRDSLIKIGSELKKEVCFFMDNGLPDYIDGVESKFTMTKTFLYRNENVKFYDIFFPVSLENGNFSQKLITCNELLEKSRFVNIIGTAGSGKTMLMKHYFLSSIKSLYKIPIFIELRNLNDYDKSLTDFIYEVIFNNRLSPDTKILERILLTGNFIFLLDGYDEIYSEKINKVTNELDRFIDRYSHNSFIISSRPGSGVEALPRFENYKVSELSNEDVFSFIDKVSSANDDLTIPDKIKQVITESFESEYSNFLRSPLLLSMFILTFNTYPELPTKKSKFYWNVFDTLATKHDSFTKKGLFTHERKTKLQNEDFESILQWFSFISLLQGKLNFDSEYLTVTLTEIKKKLNYEISVKDLIDDLTLAISIMIVDGVVYKFPHKSIQEYFCATLIKNQLSEAKEKIYKEKLPYYIRKSTGGFENLFNLLYELDKISFLKYFLIHQLNEFKITVQDNDLMTQLYKYYNYTGIGDHLVINDDSVTFTGGTIIYFTMGPIGSVLSFLNLPPVSSLLVGRNPNSLHPNLYTEVKKYVLDNVDKLEPVSDDEEDEEQEEEDGGMFLTYKNHWNPQFHTILKNNNLDKELDKFLNTLEAKVLELTQDITKDENTINSLLEI